MAEQQPDPPASHGPDPDGVRENKTGPTAADAMALVAGIVMVIASLMPWYGLNLGKVFSKDLSGWGSGFFAYTGITLCILAGLLAALRVLGVTLDLGMSDGAIYLSLGSLSLALIALRLATDMNFLKSGMYLGFIAAGLLASGGYWKLRKSKA